MNYRERYGKYNAKSTMALDADGNERRFDSKFEAAVASELRLRMLAKEIKYFDCQYKISMVPCDTDGTPITALTMNHKVDFRIHELDDTYTLLEAKGVETGDYRLRRKWLTHIFLPANLDHSYEVVKQRSNRSFRRR